MRHCRLGYHMHSISFLLLWNINCKIGCTRYSYICFKSQKIERKQKLRPDVRSGRSFFFFPYFFVVIFDLLGNRFSFWCHVMHCSQSQPRWVEWNPCCRTDDVTPETSSADSMWNAISLYFLVEKGEKKIWCFSRQFLFIWLFSQPLSLDGRRINSNKDHWH